MSISVSYGGTSILQGIQPTSIECAQLADMGETATGAFTVEDDAAALTIVGYQPVTISESACSQPRLFTGWTFERGYQRDEENAILTGSARTHDVSIIDMNACFGFRQITRTGTGGGNRPAETWAARLTWILESEYLSDWISSDQSFVVANTTMVDATDYRGSYPSAVLQDLSDRSGNAYDYFAFWDPAAQEVRLFFDNAVASIGESTLRISNVLSDWDGDTTFAPDKLAKLQRESDQVYSDVCVNYADGTLKLYRSRPSTYQNFVRRSTQIDRPYTRSAATATLQAEAWLDKHSVETDRISCTIRVPASRVGLVQAGQRIQFKAPHMPGYTAFMWMRVVMCTPKPADETATLYDIALELIGAPADVVPCNWQTLTTGVIGNGVQVLKYSNTYDGGPNLYPTPFTGATSITVTAGNWYRFYGQSTGACFPDGGGCYGGRIDPWCDTFLVDRYQAGQFIAGPPNWGFGVVCYLQNDVYEGEGSTLWADPSWPGREVVPPGSTQTLYFGFQKNCGNNTGTGTVWIEDLGPGDSEGPYTTPPAASSFPIVGCGDDDEETDLGPSPGATTLHDADPTVDDDAAAGYTTGSHWVNETSGHEFVLVDSTTGSAVWVSTTAISVFSFSTTDGVTTVDPTTSLTFVGATLADLGGGDAEVTLNAESGTPALTFGTTNVEGSASTVVLTDATLAIFDATAPTTGASGDVAAVGTAAVAARRDHRHGMPAFTSELVIADVPVDFPHGTFFTTASQTVGSTTTAYAVAFAGEGDVDGLTHSTVTNNSRIYIETSGEYNIIVSAIADLTSGTNQHVDLWLAIDGSPVDDSNTIVQVVSTAETLIAASFNLDLSAGQYFEIMYHGDSTACQLLQTAAAASPTRPASPAVILTVNMEAPTVGFVSKGITLLMNEAEDDLLYGD